jgi:predicted ABC-type ATPase
MSAVQPRLVVVGGPNGSGKTTLAREYALEHGLRYLGADDIAARMNPANPAAVRVAAARAFSRELRAAIAAGDGLVVESTLSGGSLSEHLHRACKAGYVLSVVMVFLDSEELCLHRVAQRVAAGGHDVPEADVRRRFRRSLRQFMSRYRLIADDWTLVFNGDSGYDTVAHGQNLGVQIIFDEVLWALFLQLATPDPDHADTDSD